MIIPTITHINRKLLVGINEVLKPWGLNASDWRVFRHLADFNTATASAMASAYDMDRAAVSRTISKLEAMGVLQIASAQDKREKLLELSANGKQIYFDANICVKNYSSKVLGEMSHSEQGTLLNLLDKINKNLEKLGEQK